MLIKSKKNAYLLQIPIPLGNLLGLQESNVDFVNPMVNSHLFRPSWFYKLFYTDKLIDVLKTQNNLSIYELLGKIIFRLKIFSTLPYLHMMSFIFNAQSI